MPMLEAAAGYASLEPEPHWSDWPPNVSPVVCVLLRGLGSSLPDDGWERLQAARVAAGGLLPRPRTDPDGRPWVPAAPAGAISWRATRWRPAALLAGDRSGDYELEYRVARLGDTPATGWYLYGNGIFGEAWGGGCVMP